MVFSQLSSFVCQALSHQSSPAKKPVPVKPSRATEIFTHRKSDIWKPTLPVPEKGQCPGPREVIP